MMTIDRLEELHTLTGQFAKTAVDAGYDLTAVDFATDVRSLIDAEIERQSVGDEENRVVRVNALGESLQSQLDEFVHPHCDYGVYSGMYEEISELQEIAIDALRAYRKPEPCEWCDGKSEDLLHGGNPTLKITKNYSWYIDIECLNYGGDWGDCLDINYCPNCGRRLEVEHVPERLIK